MKIAVIGGGISGLATAFLTARSLPDATVEVFEKNDRPGGTIGTQKTDKFVIEMGPNGFLSGKPTTLQLADHLGIANEMIEAEKAAEKRFICRGGKLVSLPEGPKQFLGSNLLTIGGKLRVAMEPFIAKRTDGHDETVAEFGNRRLGKQVVRYLLDPMITGVFAGAADKLSLKSCFPRIHQLEQEYGGLIKAMRKLKAKKASPPGRLTSFENGMYYLIEQLAASDKITVHLSSPVTKIEQGADGFQFDASTEKYHALVLASPSHALAKMEFAPLADIRESLANISYPPVSIVAFAIPKGYAEGFGFLIPSSEKRDILGALFSSNIFNNRSKCDYDLVSVLIGGDRRHEVLDFTDEQTIDTAAKELSQIMGIDRAKTEKVSMFRWDRAIPQYYQGHSKIVEQCFGLEQKHPGLFFTGNAFSGVGINDCTRAAYETAQKVTDFFGAK